MHRNVTKKWASRAYILCVYIWCPPRATTGKHIQQPSMALAPQPRWPVLQLTRYGKYWISWVYPSRVDPVNPHNYKRSKVQVKMQSKLLYWGRLLQTLPVQTCGKTAKYRNGKLQQNHRFCSPKATSEIELSLHVQPQLQQFQPCGSPVLSPQLLDGFRAVCTLPLFRWNTEPGVLNIVRTARQVPKLQKGSLPNIRWIKQWIRSMLGSLLAKKMPILVQQEPIKNIVANLVIGKGTWFLRSAKWVIPFKHGQNLPQFNTIWSWNKRFLLEPISAGKGAFVFGYSASFSAFQGRKRASSWQLSR